MAVEVRGLKCLLKAQQTVLWANRDFACISTAGLHLDLKSLFSKLSYVYTWLCAEGCFLTGTRYPSKIDLQENLERI